MFMHIANPDLYEKDITKCADGTFSVCLSPWFDEPINGIPTKELALQFLHAAHEAMREYAYNAQYD